MLIKNREFLYQQIRSKNSYLCVGLDPVLDRLPNHLSRDAAGVVQFCKEIIDATSSHCIAYKPNIAFFESLGRDGYAALEEVVKHIPAQHLKLLDAKRGDIGNTAEQYAVSYLDQLNCDAITLSPYMGSDSVRPFIKREGKWGVLLALTSNPSATELQVEGESQPLYQTLIRKSQQWGTADQIMYVVGATRPDYIAAIRNLAPNHFFLVPGVGAQGGDLAAVAAAGINSQVGLLVNSSRGIIYASADEDFAEQAGRKAKELQGQMEILLQDIN